MTKRGIDMLPLLDVFMVVLFVFATIQEQQLDTSVQELDDVSTELERAAAERERQAAQVEKLEAQVERLREREDQVNERVEAYEQVCGPPQPGGSVCPPAQLNPNAKAQAAMASLHERLLDNVAVFEIEIGGQPDMATGQLRNLCCYRADPPKGEWQSCGEIPSAADQRIAWLADGGDGLIRGLSRTRGGDPIVILRQGDSAGYRVSNDLAELLREQTPGSRIYDDGSTGAPLECPRLRD